MLLHKTYKNDLERQSIIGQMIEDNFVEVPINGVFIEGEHLLFSDGKPDKPEYRSRFDDLEDIIVDLSTIISDLTERITELEAS